MEISAADFALDLQTHEQYSAQPPLLDVRRQAQALEALVLNISTHDSDDDFLVVRSKQQRTVVQYRRPRDSIFTLIQVEVKDQVLVGRKGWMLDDFLDRKLSNH